MSWMERAPSNLSPLPYSRLLGIPGLRCRLREPTAFGGTAWFLMVALLLSAQSSARVSALSARTFVQSRWFRVT